MFRATLSNVRAHLPRLIAVSLAVILAVAFMSATLILNSSTKATLRASLAADYANATLIVSSDTEGGTYEPIPVAAIDQIAALPEVDEVFAAKGTAFAFSHDDVNQEHMWLEELAPDGLRTTELDSGEFPTGDGEIALDANTATQFDLGVGDMIDVTTYTDDGQKLADDATTATIVGITKPTSNPFGAATNTFLASSAYLSTLTGGQLDPDWSYSLQVLAASGADLTALSQQIADTMADTSAAQFTVQTPDEIVNAQMSSLTGGADILTAVLFAFVAVAVFVCALVISNTFSVLVAQRTRELALLRCIGADRRQVRNSVLIEALIMASVASVIGVLAAAGLMSGLIGWAHSTGVGASLGVFSADWTAFAVPIVVGITMTLIAASGPARAATRVAPLAAMRPVDEVSVSTGAGRARLVLGSAFLGVGVVMLLGGSVFPALMQMMDDPSSILLTLPLALFGAIVSAVGVLMLAVFYIPAVTGWVGRLTGVAGVPGRLAALNSVRNPRRTAATASALLIGVTLVSTIYTGAGVARATFANSLDEAYPVDLSVSTGQMVYAEDSEGDGIADEEASGITTATMQKIDALDGVEAAVPVLQDYAIGDAAVGEFWGVSAVDYARVTRTPQFTVQADTILSGTSQAGDTITLVGTAGSATVKVVDGGAPNYVAIMPMEVFRELSSNTLQNGVMIKTVDGLTSSELLNLRDEISALVPDGYVSGSALERASFDQIIDILLLIVTGLLAVAVVIALIGVGNTLSLSVIERTRESALLRALGLTKAQLRGMLAIEALLLSAVAAVLGALMGVGYGYVGAWSVLGVLGTVPFVVPWVPLLIIIGIAALAGLLASVLPAHRAARLSPVAGLATT